MYHRWLLHSKNFFEQTLIRWGVLLVFLSMTGALAAATSVTVQLFWLGLLVSVAIVLHCHDQPSIRESLPDIVKTLLRLSTDRELQGAHQEFAEELLKIGECPDHLFRTLASAKLQGITQNLQTLGRHTVEYESTEAWRVAYEQLLRSPGLYLYRSVSHVETRNYWQDGPGRQSTQLNIELQQSGIVIVERIVILAPHLWSSETNLPDEPVRSWIDEQARSGIRIRLVHEGRLLDERELVNDFGIYGSRAVGMQRTDATGRTSRFRLSFDFEDVRRAERCWEQLLLHSADYVS